MSNQTTTSTVMDELLSNYQMPTDLEVGQLVEGTVINKKKNCILIEIDGITTGMISGKETKDNTNTAKKAKVGDKLTAVVIEKENDDGFVILSLRESGQQKSWENLVKMCANKEVVKIKAKEANKGGLLVDFDGITGFLPVSQLAPLHYPRVDDADASKILQKLQRLVNVEFNARIIAIDKDTNKLIFSEKELYKELKDKELKKLKIGQKINGKISGIVKFGIFVTFNDGLEGLVHISEIEWGHVANPENYGVVGKDLEALVIGIDGEKISLSIKQLSKDPWVEAAKNIKMGQVIKGKINRLSDFGAFLSIDDQINGLIHVSEMFDKDGKPAKKPEDAVKIGDELETRVIAIDSKEHRIGLSMKLKEEKKESETKANKEKEAKNDKKEEKKSKKETKKE